MIYDITPVPKPRMTRRDKWLDPPRPCVARYRAFCDEVRLKGLWFKTDGARITFRIPMPKSWSKAKKAEMIYDPHLQTPDLSNLLKAIEDAVYKDDSKIWHYSDLCKVWAETGSIEIR